MVNTTTTLVSNPFSQGRINLSKASTSFSVIYTFCGEDKQEDDACLLFQHFRLSKKPLNLII
jgi:hypothetical protein